MDMHTRLIGLRDRVQINHRLRFKARMLEERRKRIIQHLPPADKTMESWQQLTLSEEDINRMLDAQDILAISKLFRAPEVKVKEVLSTHARQFLQLARNNLIGGNRIMALCVIGNIAASEFFSTEIINDTVVQELIELFSETSAPEQLKVFFCVFRDLYQHTNRQDVFWRVREQYLRVEEALGGDIPIEFLEMVNEFKAPELQPDQPLVQRIIEKKFRVGQPADLLQEVLQLVEKTLRPRTHHEDTLQPYHHSEGQHSSRFHYYVLEFIRSSLAANFSRDLKAQLIELVGVVISSRSNGDIVDYVLQHPLLDELITRSKIDVHQLKFAAINSLSTLTIFCDRKRLLDLSAKGMDEVFVMSLKYTEPQLLLKVLRAVAKYLLQGLKQQLMRYRVEQLLFGLQQHSNKAVYDIVEILIEEFFQDEFEP